MQLAGRDLRSYCYLCATAIVHGRFACATCERVGREESEARIRYETYRDELNRLRTLVEMSTTAMELAKADWVTKKRALYERPLLGRS